MKKILVSIFCLSSVFTFAQLRMERLDGTPINNGDVFTYNDATYPGSIFSYKMFNDSDQEITVKSKVISITNGNGTNVQFCIGLICVANLTVGNSYPNTGVIIDAQGDNGNFDHFENSNTGLNPALPLEYTFKYYMVNASNVEVGNSVTYTYRYTSNLGVAGNSLENTGIQLQSNVIANELNIRATKNVEMTLFDMNGRLVNTSKLTSGDHAINVSNLNAGVYIANFVNDEGRTATSKIIKK
ncbi:T9SS type A sorting domain-containing protein [Flavobacterium sp. 3HN19-14]|uniref:T9SS type A sorting domain-containing protein n=1 Tax=Flavobacterium sp. 3HN19-14 TaxID=3448133 RepID=UPI003EE38566